MWWLRERAQSQTDLGSNPVTWGESSDIAELWFFIYKMATIVRTFFTELIKGFDVIMHIK